jgi:hypothetical protein
VRWGILAGGLLIIADLTTRLILQRAGQDAAEALGTIDVLVNAVLLAVAGASVERESGGIRWAALAGLLAGLLDALVIAAANGINPPPDQGNPLYLALQNVAQGPVLATAAAWVSSLARRRTGR